MFLRQINSHYTGNHSALYLLFIGDIHLGNKYINLSYLDRALRFANKHRKNCRIVLIGDLLEAATKASVGRGVFDEDYCLQRQFEEAIELLDGFRDNIDFVIDGNHEERIMRDTSFEITQEICHRIGVIDAYSKFQGILNIRMNTGLTYSIHAWHGTTSGTKDSSAVNALLGMRNKVTSHIYAMGHTHKLFHFSKKHYIPNPGGELLTIDQHFVNTGTCLDVGGYGEQKGLEPTRIGFGGLILYADVRKTVFFYVDDVV